MALRSNLCSRRFSLLFTFLLNHTEYEQMYVDKVFPQVYNAITRFSRHIRLEQRELTALMVPAWESVFYRATGEEA